MSGHLTSDRGEKMEMAEATLAGIRQQTLALGPATRQERPEAGPPTLGKPLVAEAGKPLEAVRGLLPKTTEAGAKRLLRGQQELGLLKEPVMLGAIKEAKPHRTTAVAGTEIMLLSLSN